MWRFFLIRHGETVDNVANLYAGSRDSELTNHGFQQAQRLASHFVASGIEITHIYSSQLKRAVKTAEAIQKAQDKRRDADGKPILPPLTQSTDLAEQDFGSLEGVSFLAREPGSKVTGKDRHIAAHKDDEGFVDVESKESMQKRIDAFLDEHLVPKMPMSHPGGAAVAIVSHGITLSRLWRRLLQRLPPKSVTLHPEVTAKHAHHGGIDLERIGGWTNTGYLELEITFDYSTLAAPTPEKVVVASPPKDSALTSDPPPPTAAAPERKDAIESSSQVKTSAPPANVLPWKITVCGVNCRDHLTGLKRTGGGVGSARHDDRQKGIESFFKRRKVE